MQSELNDAELASCVALLERIAPEDLELPQLAALRAAGMRLFKRDVMKNVFGSTDVVGFLAEKTQQKKKMRELKKLDAVVSGKHRRERINASECGLNENRKAQLELIKQQCAEEARREEDASAARITCVDPVGAVSTFVPASPRSICITLAFQPAASTSGVAVPSVTVPSITVVSGLGGGHGDPHKDEPQTRPLEGDVRKICNVCRGDHTHLPPHPFYHQLCPRCGDFNYKKREQSAMMDGAVAIVTGGRVRIGWVATTGPCSSPTSALMTLDMLTTLATRTTLTTLTVLNC